MAKKLQQIRETNLDIHNREHLLQVGTQIFDLKREGSLAFSLEGNYKEIPLMAMRKMAQAWISQHTGKEFYDPLADEDFCIHEIARARAAAIRSKPRGILPLNITYKERSGIATSS